MLCVILHGSKAHPWCGKGPNTPSAKLSCWTFLGENTFPSGSSRCRYVFCGPWGWLYAVKSIQGRKSLVIRGRLGTQFVLSILPSLTSLSCSCRVALPHCTAQNQTCISSDFQLSCSVNEQLGNNNLRDLLHLLYTSNKLYWAANRTPAVQVQSGSRAQELFQVWGRQEAVQG